MPIQTLQVLERKIERQIRLFELRNRALGRKLERKLATQKERIGQKFDAHKLRIEQQFDAQKKRFESHIRRFELKNGIRIDDEFRFFRTWIEKPLSMGAVTPSGKALARTMAEYVDPHSDGPIIELGPGTGPVTEALVAQGIDPARLVLVEFDPTFCRLLRARDPQATGGAGDGSSLKGLLAGRMQNPAAGVVSGLPLFTKPLRMRLRLLFDALDLMAPGAPFIQFTYNAVPPIPKRLERVSAEPSERVWMNIPPARVWVYRRD